MSFLINSTPDKTATEGQTYTYNPTTADGTVADSWSLAGAPADMTFNSTTGAISWFPLDTTNSGSLLLSAYTIVPDETTTQDWTIAVTLVAPSITNNPDTTATEASLYTYTPTYTASDLYRFDLTGAPAGMTVDHTTGVVSWTPNYDQSNSGPLTLTLYDKNDLTASKDWTIASPFIAPVITSTPDTTATEGSGYHYTPTSTVVHFYRYALTGSIPSGMTFDTTTGRVDWTPSYDLTSTGTLTLGVYSLNGLNNTQDWTIGVNFVTPSITNSPRTDATEGTLYTYTPTATVVDKWKYDLTGAPTGMTVDSTTGVVSWTPLYDTTNSGPLTLTLRSYNGLTDHKDWTVAVTPLTNVVIDVQPSSQSVQQSGVLNLSVTAHGTGTLYYQWKHNGINVGTDSNTYSKTDFKEEDAGAYTVVITDLSGPVTSDTATVTMRIVASSDRHGASRGLVGLNTLQEYTSAWWLQ